MRFVSAIIVALLLCNVASAQIISKQTQRPAVRALPAVVQQMSDCQYQAWAKWHNQLAEQYAEQFNSRQERYQRTLVTTYNSSGSNTSSLDGYRNRKTGEYGATGQGSFNSGGTSYTYEIQRRVPGQVQGVLYYNPYCKPSIDALPTDWSQIFLLVDGKIVSVADVAKQLSEPIPCEVIYERLIQYIMGPPAQPKPTQKPKNLT